MLPIWKTRTTLRLGMSTKIRRTPLLHCPKAYQPTDSYKANYLELFPEIQTLGKGYGYAKYYTEPAGHVYSLWTVTSPQVQK